MNAELASAPKAGGRFTFAPNGVPARIALALLTTAGILYGNIGPVIVSGLAQTAQFTSETAGYVFSANMYGSAIGGFGVVLVLRRINWRISAAVLLALLMICDLMSANGTYVNGKKTNISYLSPEDRIRIGPVECIFHIPARKRSGGGRPRTKLVAIIVLVVAAALAAALMRWYLA